MTNWLLYGAYGFTGKLLAEEAVKRGHKPVLAGRDERKTAVLAQKLGLDYVACDLNDTDKLHQIVAGVDLVMHAAGPFIYTSEPMIQACLAGQSHYLDITGEIPVLETTLSYDAHAREQGVALISGAGFDIVPTDCLARYVADQLPTATHLEIAFWGLSGASGGTAKTMLEMMADMPGGSMVRRNGRLINQPFGAGQKEVTFSNGKTRTVFPIPWGDLATAETSTGIANVTAYMSLPPTPGMRYVSPVAARLMRVKPLRSLAKKVVDWTIHGPDDDMQQTARSYIWACARDDEGNRREAWLDTIEVYRLTAVAGILAIEKVLADHPSGALTPSQAFGPDFVLEIGDTRRYDALPA